MLKQIRISVFVLGFMLLVTGIIYPVFVTFIASILFPWQANGSIIELKDKKVGSLLIGQFFDDPKYFWGRPSSTLHFPYNAEDSSGSNYGPNNPVFLDKVKKRCETLKSFSGIKHNNGSLSGITYNIPVDLVLASGSGLDPHISPMAAYYQADRIAEFRKIPVQEIFSLIRKLTKNKTFWILGEARINVLELNLALDRMEENRGTLQ